MKSPRGRGSPEKQKTSKSPRGSPVKSPSGGPVERLKTPRGSPEPSKSPRGAEVSFAEGSPGESCADSNEGTGLSESTIAQDCGQAGEALPISPGEFRRKYMKRRSSDPAPKCPQNATSKTEITAQRRPSAPTNSVPQASPRTAGPDKQQGGGDVNVCIRLRPAFGKDICTFVEGPDCVRLGSTTIDAAEADPRGQVGDLRYNCNNAFGPESTQEAVYDTAVAPVCQAVLDGYNCAVIAYGQTGSGKTHTIVGTEQDVGVIPRAVNEIFTAAHARKQWSVEVSVLEIYNERTRDLLTPDAKNVEIREIADTKGMATFHCPDATRLNTKTPNEALAALHSGLERRETQRTDMNHTSSRSHLIFTLAISTSEDLVTTLRGHLHLVDLAGSERLKRSMSSAQAGSVVAESPAENPDSPKKRSSNGGNDALRALRLQDEARQDRDREDKRQKTLLKEAGAINKSLMHLALVIQRLTQAASRRGHIPYRDSALTRLLADSFGGSSKTCLIINCSPLTDDRDETQCALEFGKRAGLVKNMAEKNVEVADVVKALVAKELERYKKEQDELRYQLSQASADATDTAEKYAEEVKRLEDERDELEKRLSEASTSATEIQEESAAQISSLQDELQSLRKRLQEMKDLLAGMISSRMGNDDGAVSSTGEVSDGNEAGQISAAGLRQLLSESLKTEEVEQVMSTVDPLDKGEISLHDVVKFFSTADVRVDGETTTSATGIHEDSAAQISSLQDELHSLRMRLREMQDLLAGMISSRMGSDDGAVSSTGEAGDGKEAGHISAAGLRQLLSESLKAEEVQQVMSTVDPLDKGKISLHDVVNCLNTADVRLDGAKASAKKLQERRKNKWLRSSTEEVSSLQEENETLKERLAEMNLFLAGMVSSSIAIPDNALQVSDSLCITTNGLKMILADSLDGDELQMIMDEIQSSDTGRLSLRDFIAYLNHGASELRHGETVIQLLEATPSPMPDLKEDKSLTSSLRIPNFGKAAERRLDGGDQMRSFKPPARRSVRDANTQTKDEDETSDWFSCFKRPGSSPNFDAPRSPWCFSPRTPA